MSAGTDKSNQQAQSQGTTSSNVWSEMVPFLQDLYGRGQGLVDQFQPDTQMFGQAQQAWQQQINPQGNPYLDQMAGQFQDQLGIMNQQTGGAAGLTGGFGGGRHGVAESLNVRNMGQQMGSFYGGQYQQDQNRAMGALGMGQSVLGLAPQQQQMQNLQQYGGLIGSPVMTSQGTSTSGSKSKGLEGGII